MSEPCPKAFDSGGFSQLNNKEMRAALRQWEKTKWRPMPRPRFGQLVPGRRKPIPSAP
jgi:hypothetical protein